MTTPSPVEQKTTVASAGICWWPPLLMMAVTIMVLTISCYSEVDQWDRPNQLLFGLIALHLGFVSWVRGYSRMRPAAQIKTLICIITLEAFFALMLGRDSFNGSRWPLIAWRWNTSANLLQRTFDPPDRHQVTVPMMESHSAWDILEFRGQNRSGIVTGVALERNWDLKPPKLLWQREIGVGWSSFSVCGDHCVTQEQREENEAIVCYHIHTGEQVWEHRYSAQLKNMQFGNGPRATPTIYEGRIYAQGATGILSCVEGRTGGLIWSRDIIKDDGGVLPLFGYAISPLVVDDLVITSPGGKGCSLAAYHKLTGKPVWAAGDELASYASPQLANFSQHPQVLIFNAGGLYAHSLQDGALLWNVPWVSPPDLNNVCQPIPFLADEDDPHDRLFLSSDYGVGCALLEIHKNDAEHWSWTDRWRNQNLKSKYACAVVRNGYVFGFDMNLLACVELKSGKRQWKAGRYGYGQLLCVGDCLVIQAESGEVALVDASAEKFTELGKFTALDWKTWNVPVLSGNRLLVRNDRQAACYELPASQLPPK